MYITTLSEERRKPIIDQSLFYVFYLFIKYSFGGGDQGMK